MIDDQIYSVDERLEPYLQSFIIDAQEYGHDFTGSHVILRISNLHPYSHGRTYMRRDGIAHVTLDSALYQLEMRLDTVHLKYVVYHELGHAFLRKGHVDNCSNVMNAIQECSLHEFRVRQEDMIKQLFTSR